MLPFSSLSVLRRPPFWGAENVNTHLHSHDSLGQSRGKAVLEKENPFTRELSQRIQWMR